jgi:hypothetical protein
MLAIYTPVLILHSIFVVVYAFYVRFYIYPLVGTESDRPDNYFWEGSEEHDRARVRGWVLFGVMTFSLLMLVIASVRAMLTDPGHVPDVQDWQLVTQEEDS